jgi:hypothetical protein
LVAGNRVAVALESWDRGNCLIDSSRGLVKIEPNSRNVIFGDLQKKHIIVAVSEVTILNFPPAEPGLGREWQFALLKGRKRENYANTRVFFKVVPVVVLLPPLPVSYYLFQKALRDRRSFAGFGLLNPNIKILPAIQHRLDSQHLGFIAG